MAEVKTPGQVLQAAWDAAAPEWWRKAIGKNPTHAPWVHACNEAAAQAVLDADPVRTEVLAAVKALIRLLEDWHSMGLRIDAIGRGEEGRQLTLSVINADRETIERARALVDGKEQGKEQGKALVPDAAALKREGAVAALRDPEVRHAVYLAGRPGTCNAMERMAVKIQNGEVTPW